MLPESRGFSQKLKISEVKEGILLFRQTSRLLKLLVHECRTGWTKYFHQRIRIRSAEAQRIMADPALCKSITFGHLAEVDSAIHQILNILVVPLTDVQPRLLALMA